MQQKEQKNTAELRNKRISNIKDSLKKISIIRKNTTKVQQKIKSDNLSESSSPEIKFFNHGNDINTVGLHQIQQSSLFDEKYQMQQCIGQGANGFVNKCRKIKTGKTYAVKSQMMDQEHIMELKQNFLAIHSLKHPNIVQYHALYIDMRKKLCSIVMQYVQFPSLNKFKITDQQQLKQIIYQLLNSVKYLHQKHISHRDLKPQNIMYDHQNKLIKIIDFGTAKNYYRRSKKFQMLTITGTLFYRAPQMFIGGGYDQKVDIWAIGILIYKLVCGKTPFQSIYLSDTINRIKQESLTFQEKAWEKIDESLKNLIRRMLKKDRFKRLSAAQCLRDVWFYSLPLNKLSDSTKDYKQYKKNLQNAEYNKKIIKKVQQQPKNFESLTYIVQKIDGEDYHLIDSQQQETACSPKSSKKLTNQRKTRKKLAGSMIF